MPSSALPLVCVVICNFNKRDDVVVAIESVRASRGVRVEIIVVDNCSSDGSVQAIEALHHQNVQIIQLPENIGGSGGFRVGMEASKSSSAEFVLLLDNDASVAPDTITGLVDAMKNDPELGAVGPAILKAYAPGEIQDVGGFLSSEFFLHWPGFNSLPIDDLSLPPLYCEYLAACCLLTRRSVIEEVGSFDESFFIYWDDVDWCTRVRNTGYKLKVFPEFRSWHKGGIQTATSTVPTYYNVRNRVRFFSRYPSSWPFDSTVSGIRKNLYEVFLGCLIKGDHSYIDAYLTGFYDGFDQQVSSPPIERLNDRRVPGSSTLPITMGGTYAFRFADWFSDDTQEVRRLNPQFPRNDLYKLSRLISCVRALKSTYQIRCLVDPTFFAQLNAVEQRILSRFVEVISATRSLKTLMVYRHISDALPASESNTLVIDSYLNTLPGNFDVLRAEAQRLAFSPCELKDRN